MSSATADAGAAAVGELELVERLDPLDVGRHHPLVVDALVVDEQRARLRLVEHVERVEVIADRLVAEPLALEVEQDPVLAVVEGQIGELVGVGVGDLRGDQVAVEAGVRRSERGARPRGRAAGRRRRCWGWPAAVGPLPSGWMCSARRAGSPPKPPVASSVERARITRCSPDCVLDLGADHGSVLEQQVAVPSHPMSDLAAARARAARRPAGSSPCRSAQPRP